jgi:hypothetical protein
LVVYSRRQLRGGHANEKEWIADLAKSIKFAAKAGITQMSYAKMHELLEQHELLKQQ